MGKMDGKTKEENNLCFKWRKKWVLELPGYEDTGNVQKTLKTQEKWLSDHQSLWLKTTEKDDETNLINNIN